MPTTIEHIKGAELPPFLQKRFNVRPEQFLKITIEIEEAEEEIDEDLVIENLGDSIIRGLKEIADAKKNGVKLPNARELLKEL